MWHLFMFAEVRRLYAFCTLLMVLLVCFRLRCIFVAIRVCIDRLVGGVGAQWLFQDRLIVCFNVQCGVYGS